MLSTFYYYWTVKFFCCCEDEEDDDDDDEDNGWGSIWEGRGEGGIEGGRMIETFWYRKIESSHLDHGLEGGCWSKTFDYDAFSFGGAFGL